MRLTTFISPRLPLPPSHPSPMPFDPIARFYDADHGRLTADIPALLAFAEKTGGPVLDLGVGTGRLALAMAGAGHEVVGIDSAAGMLAIARARIAAAGLEKLVTLVEADFRAFTRPERFGLAYCGFNGFLHLIDEADQLDALRCWRRLLRPDGLLVIDVDNPSLERLAAADGSLGLADQWTDAETGHTIYALTSSYLDFADQVQTVHFIYDEVLNDGVVRRAAARIPTRVLFRREVHLLLQMAGYGRIRFYGDYDLAPWEADSPRILTVARAS